MPQFPAPPCATMRANRRERQAPGPTSMDDTAASQDAWRARLLGGPGVVLAGLWGFAEGTLLFIVPDVLLSLAAMLGGRRALRHVMSATAGALAAGGLLFAWSAASPAAQSVVGQVPFVSPQMFEAVDRAYQHQGAWAPLLGPLSGIPYKVYAVEAPRHVSLPRFLAATVPARLERFLLVWLLFAALGVGLRSWKPAHARLALGMHAALWIGFYAFYWSVI